MIRLEYHGVAGKNFLYIELIGKLLSFELNAIYHVRVSVIGEIRPEGDGFVQLLVHDLYINILVVTQTKWFIRLQC